MKQLKIALGLTFIIVGVFLGTYGVLEVKNWMSFPIYVSGFLTIIAGVIGMVAASLGE